VSKSELEVAVEHHRRGDIAAAIGGYRRLLLSEPANAEAHRLLGVAALQTGDLKTADDALSRAAVLAPASAQVRADLGAVKLAQRRFHDASELLEAVLQSEPHHPDALNNCGIAYAEMGQIERALPYFERLTRIRLFSAAAFRQLGDAQYKLGQAEEAVESFRRAIELDGDNRKSRLALGEAFESLGRWREARAQYTSLLRRMPDSPLALARLIMLRGEQPRPEWIQAAQRIVSSSGVKPEPRARVALALAHYYDRRAEYQQAFRFLDAGNSILRARRPYDASLFSQAVDHLIEVFSAETLRQLSTSERTPNRRPLFILGMPRSGTTLVEQILASHSSVEAGGELSTMLNAAVRVRRTAGSSRDYPHSVLDLNSEGIGQLANYYMRRINRISSDAPHVTDKLPFNFMHVGLIHLLFPQAIIIHCQRDPMDTCLSCYFTSFSQEIRFANDLGTLGTYYRNYQRLMAHWTTVLPGRMLNIVYEDLVRNPEQQIRQLIESTGLPWEDQCLEFYNSDRGIRTPSRWQVRQKIGQSSVGRWLNYETWLSPLQATLRLVQ
jgi:Flp pilus assembly protein TadD